MNTLIQIVVGLGLAFLCMHIPIGWIGGPHDAMIAGVLTGMLTADIISAATRRDAE